MDVAFPYTRYACPCADHVSGTPTSHLGKRGSQEVEKDADEEHTFDPTHDLRANFSLYPLDHLLFCDECTNIKCERCWTEEILYWYCPNCLFEVPTSTVKSDGNRCARHCYDCPVCSANLTTTVMNRQSDAHLRPDSSSTPESYILKCGYCEWSSLDIDVTFTRHNKITEQLNKIWKSRTMPEDRQQNNNESLSHDNAFANLSSFYKDQLSESGDTSSAYTNSPYSSPANLARIMSLYGGLSLHTQKKMKEKPQPMREAGNRVEGLSTYSAEDGPGDDELLARMSTLGMDGTASQKQQIQAPSNYDIKFTGDLWPTATKLRIIRGKRCRTCRQFLARPETKVGSMRYKVRLLAMHNIPRLSIKPLSNTPQLQPVNSATFHMRPEPIEPVILRPHQTQQYVLTVRNPIFEAIRVTLATPATTPGRVASKVTILCPSFTVGAAGDRWEEALAEPAIGINSDGSRKAAMASLTGSADPERQPEAGKVWDRSKSATSVIIEVVPGALGDTLRSDQKDQQRDPLDEDEDILEIPIYVRAEWDAIPHGVHEPDTPERETRELAYWSVLGVGRIPRG